MRRRVGAVVAAVTCALLAGCVQMPTDGPVVEPQVSADVDDVPGISFDPRPPQAGESPTEIVAGFLEAMRATPVSPAVARQFLSQEAAEGWLPDQQIMTYAELGSAVGTTAVQIPLTDVNLYDARGAWERTRPRAELQLRLVEEDGEWRIDDVPDALIVPDAWFDDWFQRASLYFFDPTSEVLVPEPVHVPRGDQFASSLVRGLLLGPDEDDQDVLRTYFPPGTSHGLSVPISPAGIADVALSGDPGAVDGDTAQRMLAQLVWTLRQEPLINAVQLTVGGRAFGGSSGSTQVGLDVGSAYDPNGAGADTHLFALDRGRVVTGSIGAFEETLGPLGQDDYGVRSIAASLGGSRIAAVTADGTSLYLAPTEAPGGDVATAVTGAVDLDAPDWDYRDRVWMLDRGAGQARVILVVDGTAGVVDVPGVTGRNVTRLLVSRDGSRIVAVVRGPDADTVVAARIRYDQTGALLGFTPFVTLPLPDEGSPRVRDIGWRSPTSISVLSDFNEDLSQVRTVSVDGAPGETTTGGSTRLRGPIRKLVSTPVSGVDLDVYALAGRSVYSLTRPERTVPPLPRGLTSLTYVG